MCGRYILSEEPKSLYQRYNIDPKLQKKQLAFEPSYNIAPGSLVPVVIKNSPLNLELMKWGLIPHWARDPKIAYKLINARGETAAQKPSFKSSFKNRRCLVPATGFYEWQTTKEGKVPYLFRLKREAVFSFAGLYDIWTDVEGKEFKTFTIITTKANQVVSPIHHRMPVILNQSNENKWLDENTSDDSLQKLLKPCPQSVLKSYKVSTKVNNPRNQGEELIRKA